MAHSEPRILSQPHRVIFAGFESTTTELQQAGWRLSVEQDIMRDQIRLAMRLEEVGLYMMAEQQQYHFQGTTRSQFQSTRDTPGRLTFIIRHCSSRIEVRLMESSFNFRPIDAAPQFIDTPYKRIEDFGIFALPLVRTEEIIIEPQSVAECLDLIRKMQAPELVAVRKRNEQRDYSQATNQQQFHAQIMSLAA